MLARKLVIVTFSLLMFSYSASAVTYTMDFESLTPGTSYAYGESFADGGVTINVGEFDGYNGGEVYVEDPSSSFLGSIDLFFGNVTLDFVIPESVDQIVLDIGAYGGDCEIVINGTSQAFWGVDELDGLVIGGVELSILDSSVGPYDDGSTLGLEGTVSSFGIGGQEVAIDNVVMIPEPATLGLLLIGGLALLRKRK